MTKSLYKSGLRSFGSSVEASGFASTHDLVFGAETRDRERPWNGAHGERLCSLLIQPPLLCSARKFACFRKFTC